MVQNLTNYDQALKEFYEGAIRETINNEVMAFKMFDESDRMWAGRHVRFPVHTARNPGVGARAEGGTLPTAGNQAYQEARVTATYQYGRIQVSGPVIEAGKNAFAMAMETEMKGVTSDLINDLGRQTWGTGDGRIAQVGTAGASSTSIAVYNRYAEPGQPGARYVYQSQLLDFGTVASPTALASSQTVVSVALSTNPATTTDTITISDSTVSVSQCETFVFNRGAGGSSIEMLGLQALVDVYTQANMWGSNAFFGSSVQNINRASVSAWNANILGNSGVERIVDGNLMQTAFDTISAQSGVEPDVIWGHHDTIRAFLESVAADRRYNSPEFNAGMSSLTYNGVPLVKDRQAPYNSLFVGRRDAIKMFTLSDFKFADADGAILSRVSNQDAFEAFIRAYKNLALNDNPKKTLMIRDIKIDL